MRTWLAAVALLSAFVAGCSDGPAETDSAPAVDPAPAAPANATLEGDPEFCATESTCDFWDEMYHEYVVYDLDTTVLDVLIVPPASPDPLVHVAAARAALDAWAAGIEELGAPWFTENFTMNIYTVGLDVPTPEALSDPEIIVVAGGATETLFGIGLEPKQIACMLAGGPDAYPVHAHGGMSILATDCTGMGFTCVALNVAGGPGEERDLYDLIAHEVGHCLGAGHVGDALDFRARYAPVEDIMSYQSNPGQVHCVSTMNVRVLEGVYAHLLDRPEGEFLPEGSFHTHAPADYGQVACANP